MTRRKNLGGAAAFAPDGNTASYRPDLDARNVAADLRLVALRDIHPSPHQVRLVADPDADQALAEDLDRNGMLHPPVARPHPDIPGVVILACGHRRRERSYDLARAGRGRKFLREPVGDDSDPGAWRLPVRVLHLTQERAHALTVAENVRRKDLRPWEQACAMLRHQELLAGAGEPAGVRAAAASLGEHRGTVAPYLQVGHALGKDVLAEAELDATTANATLCGLPLEALLRAARAKTVAARAKALGGELRKAGLLSEAPKAAGPASGPARATDPHGDEKPTRSRLQVHIRRPIEELDRDAARRYLDRLLPAVVMLAERLGEGHSSPLVHHLKEAEAVLHRADPARVGSNAADSQP